jgi:hypothetical protein
MAGRDSCACSMQLKLRDENSSKIMTSNTHPVQRTVEVRRARSRSRCSRVLSHTREQHKCDRGCEEQHGSIGGLDWDRGNWRGNGNLGPEV